MDGRARLTSHVMPFAIVMTVTIVRVAQPLAVQGMDHTRVPGTDNTASVDGLQKTIKTGSVAFGAAIFPCLPTSYETLKTKP